VQGYYYYPPLSIEAFNRLLDAEANVETRDRQGAFTPPATQL
jgi:hypothetical protein